MFPRVEEKKTMSSSKVEPHIKKWIFSQVRKQTTELLSDDVLAECCREAKYNLVEILRVAAQKFKVIEQKAIKQTLQRDFPTLLEDVVEKISISCDNNLIQAALLADQALQKQREEVEKTQRADADSEAPKEVSE